MQVKDLINKIKKSVNIATTLKISESTPKQVETSIVSENHVNDISTNDSINRYTPPSINKSLSATRCK